MLQLCCSSYTNIQLGRDGAMKKGSYILGAVGACAALGIAWKEKQKKISKYNFLEEFERSDFQYFPPLFFNPKFIRLMNKQEKKKNVKLVKGVMRSAIQIESFDRQKIQLYIYEPITQDKEEKPCLIYFHGGAFYVDYLSSYHTILSNYAKIANCKVVGVCYRTLETSTYRTTLKDCYHTLLWAYENAGRFGWDRNRIAVGGDSAGGTLAAAVTHLSRDLGGPKICYQMLNYPCTDGTMSSESMRAYTDTPGWNSTLHKKLFKYMLPSIDEEIRPYFDLLSQENFEGLCDAYVEVEEFDCLHDEGQKYAEKLIEHGYSVDFNDVKGTFHAFDQNQNRNIAKEVMNLRCEMLRKGFGLQ